MQGSPIKIEDSSYKNRKMSSLKYRAGSALKNIKDISNQGHMMNLYQLNLDYGSGSLHKKSHSIAP